MEMNRLKYGAFIELLTQGMEDQLQWDKFKAYLLMELPVP